MAHFEKKQANNRKYILFLLTVRHGMSLAFPESRALYVNLQPKETAMRRTTRWHLLLGFFLLCLGLPQTIPAVETKIMGADCKLKVNRGLAKKRKPHDSCFANKHLNNEELSWGKNTLPKLTEKS